ncbi:u4/U6.U5 tri-snRNP-associated protein 2-like protein [Rhizoclosmatium globosum]|uniref:U4/U6.U5 tri-snRNP-associated protein 2-like protein n=1 Tax=Rhizoclosmatium globosum TaxID=329046 RepID=A0A1Y2BYM9_9FUNG|nr:U4/U6.U5 tri-snRNP-associated protein 2 [Rhizoclosmatium sp. JEL0117]ORY39870.1 u4/U6.U5 tri-snRNP-associated protein 2-like protein [Rhizoclosmatium globosum]|eukprot:ORY39870.1 u4/U6.U5 tri-snRNP-associated protein 2-like protein [Rhizoclosmatium globosum]
MSKRALETDGLYLETVQRHVLDFDFEALCSVSLSPLNVYACLVCGKFFQGRGTASHAYTHALAVDHHIFINLTTLKVYCLPESYEVKDATLADIKYVIRPFYTKAQIEGLDSLSTYSYDLNNKAYLPGFVGLNNIKANDYVNVVIQALAHVKPLRDFLLSDDEIDVLNSVVVRAKPMANGAKKKSTELVNRFATLVRKVWNAKAFKGQVSPHEFLQEMTNASAKQFLLTAQSDPADFLAWFLNQLHTGLGGNPRKNGSSIIHKIFQGEVRVESQVVEGAGSADSGVVPRFDNHKETTTTQSPFLFLSLDLPPMPLFQDELERNIIPQVPLADLLEKYDGVTEKEYTLSVKRFRITKLPQFLIFHIKRFTKNNFTTEKNSTIVNFPIRGMDMREYLDPAVKDSNTTYNLVANICHDGKPGAIEGAYKVHVHCKGRDQWLQIQDLFVEEIAPQMIFLSETYIQIWEKA